MWLCNELVAVALSHFQEKSWIMVCLLRGEQRIKWKARVHRPQKSGRFSGGWGGGGGGERVTHWVVVSRPRLVLTVGKWKLTPPKHTHMCFLWWHSIWTVCPAQWKLGSCNNAQIRNPYKLFAWAIVIAAFIRELVRWWRCFHFPRQHWYNWVTSQSTSISRHLLHGSQNQVPFSWAITTNHTQYVYSRPYPLQA